MDVTKVVWYVLVQLSSLNNTMSGSKVQGSEVQGLELLISGSDKGLTFFICHLSSAPDFCCPTSEPLNQETDTQNITVFCKLLAGRNTMRKSIT